MSPRLRKILREIGLEESAASAPEGRNQHFNISNDDVFEWKSVWPAIADVLGVELGPDRPISLANYLSENSTTWDRVVVKYGL